MCLTVWEEALAKQAGRQCASASARRIVHLLHRQVRILAERTRLTFSRVIRRCRPVMAFRAAAPEMEVWMPSCRARQHVHSGLARSHQLRLLRPF